VKRGIWNPLFVIGPSMAKTIASQWSKDQLRDYPWRNMTMPADKMEYMAMQAGAETMDFHELVKEGLIPATSMQQRPLHQSQGNTDQVSNRGSPFKCFL
jgi:hypothetical protein